MDDLKSAFDVHVTCLLGDCVFACQITRLQSAVNVPLFLVCSGTKHIRETSANIYLVVLYTTLYLNISVLRVIYYWL